VKSQSLTNSEMATDDADYEDFETTRALFDSDGEGGQSQIEPMRVTIGSAIGTDDAAASVDGSAYIDIGGGLGGVSCYGDAEQGLTIDEERELETLEQDATRRKRARLDTLRRERQAIAAARILSGGVQRQANTSAIASPIGGDRCVIGTPGSAQFDAAIGFRRPATIRPTDARMFCEELPTEGLGASNFMTPGRGSAVRAEFRDDEAVCTARMSEVQAEAGNGVQAPVKGLAGTTGLSVGLASNDWQGAISTMAQTVSTMADVLRDSRDNAKTSLTAVKISSKSPEGLMDELVNYENICNERNIVTYKRRWALLRPGLEGKAKTIVDLELSKRQVTPEVMAKFSEKDFEMLVKYMIGYIEKRAGLTLERKAEIALAKMSAVRMAQDGGLMLQNDSSMSIVLRI
jgi:hypothetical protein